MFKANSSRVFYDSIFNHIIELVRSLPEHHRWVHFFSKLRRLYLVHFKKDYVQQQILLRQGACRKCGCCCTLLFICPVLNKQEGLCRIYCKSRSMVCEVFPIDERDLADVELNGKTCGFYFPRDG